MKLTILSLAIWALALKPVCQGQADETAALTRSLVSRGDTARVQRVLAKAQRGEPVTVGVIGGSITQGAGASRPENCYAQRIAQWWRTNFPKAKINFVNAGIGATGSNYGALRARRDLLSHSPDFVVFEYAVNDGNDRNAAETSEGLIRQVLAERQQPALLMLFTMHQNGANAQEWQGKVGRHYELPMISFRDALWPEIQAGRLHWEDVEADQVHPNDRGHEYAARYVTSFLESVQKKSDSGKRQPQIKRLPKPLTSDLFEHVRLYEATDLKPLSNDGWAFDGKCCWVSDRPGSVLEFEIAGRALLLMDWHFRGPQGMAEWRLVKGSVFHR